MKRHILWFLMESIVAVMGRADWTLSVGEIPFAENGVSVSPAGGVYADGTVVSVSAEGPDFARWFGDVPEGEEQSATLSIRMESDVKLVPYFRRSWVLDGASLTDGYWVIPVSQNESRLTVVGKSGIALGTGLSEPSPILDLAKPVDGGYSIVGLGKEALRYAPTLCKYLIQHLTLPETLETLSQNCILNQTSLIDIVPFYPASLVSMGTANPVLANSLVAGVGKTTEINLSAPGLTRLPTQTIFGNAAPLSIDTAIIGTSVTQIDNCAFDFLHHHVPRFTVKFLGDRPTLGGQLVRDAVEPIRVVVLEDNATWASLVASLSPLTEAQRTDYESRYPEGNVSRILGVGTLGYRTCYVETLSAHDLHSLIVAGDPVTAGDDVLSYGMFDWEPGESTTLTAPEFAIFEGASWKCIGYELYRSSPSGWVWVERSSSRTVPLTQVATGSTRLVWLWQKDQVVLTLGPIPFPEQNTVTVSPASENLAYAPGSQVQVTAVGANFVRWYGDVPAGSESNRTITVTMDGMPRVLPYFRHPWSFASGTSLEDGYWVVRCTSDGNRLSAIKNGALSYADPSLAQFEFVLDLAKSIDDGYRLVELQERAFEATGSVPKLHHVTLPDSLESIQGLTFRYQNELETINPFLPPSVVSLARHTFTDTFQNSEFTLTALDLSESKIETIPMQLFFGSIAEIPIPIREITFGPNVKRIQHYMFDVTVPSLTLRFCGEMPELATDNGAQTAGPLTRHAKAVRLFVPRTQTGSWDDLLDALTPPTEAQQAAYAVKWPGEPIGKILGMTSFGQINDSEINAIYVLSWNPPGNRTTLILFR